LTDALSLMLDSGAVFRTFPLEAWYDCGLPETVLATNRALLDKRSAPAKVRGENSVIIPPVHAAEGVIVDHSVVGPYVTLDEGCEVRGSVVRNTIIGRGAVVDRAVLDGSLIGDRAVVRGRPMTLNVGDSSEIDFTG
jgi:glucose-1-phosphate thymidylyltransferase